MIKKNLFCGFCVFLFGGVLSTGVFAKTAQPITLEGLLIPMSTLQGQFEQTIKTEEGKMLQKLTGKVWLKKPKQFRWEILGQEPRLIVADGQKVWDYDKDLAQVTVQVLNHTQTAAPIFFLTGDVSSISKEFSVEALPLKHGHCLKKSVYCFELKPKQETSGTFQWIKIGFNGAQVLDEMVLLDQLGQVSQFRFKHMVLNHRISETTFKFTPPKGVDILKNQ